MPIPKDHPLFKVLTREQIKAMFSYTMPKEEQAKVLNAHIRGFAELMQSRLDPLAKPISAIEEDTFNMEHFAEFKNVPIPMESTKKSQIRVLPMDIAYAVQGEASKGKKFDLASPQAVGAVLKTDYVVIVQAKLAQYAVNKVIKTIESPTQVEAIKDFDISLKTNKARQVYDDSNPNAFKEIVQEIQNQTKKVTTRLVNTLKITFSS